MSYDSHAIMKRGSSPLVFLLLLLLPLSFAAATLAGDGDDDDSCVYTVYVRTSSTWKAGTDSIISLGLYDTYGRSVQIDDLEKWGGLMGPFHDYFERGNLDIFSGKGPCLPSPVCAVNLTSDGSGDHHGWYCNYVEVTTAGVHAPCSQRNFKIEQWLALDASPYSLTAIRNNCRDHVSGSGRVGWEIRQGASYASV